jgi:hypothetical protein
MAGVERDVIANAEGRERVVRRKVRMAVMRDAASRRFGEFLKRRRKRTPRKGMPTVRARAHWWTSISDHPPGSAGR